MRGCPGGCVWLLRGDAWLLLGGAWLLQGGVHGCPLGGVWLLPGGMHGCSGGGACMVAPGGVCVVAPGGGHAWDMTRYGDAVNERAVRILLECILVFVIFLLLR